MGHDVVLNEVPGCEPEALRRVFDYAASLTRSVPTAELFQLKCQTCLLTRAASSCHRGASDFQRFPVRVGRVAKMLPAISFAQTRRGLDFRRLAQGLIRDHGGSARASKPLRHRLPTHRMHRLERLAPSINRTWLGSTPNASAI